MNGRKATKHIQLRCPNWLYNMIKETAAKERRSVTNFILLIVERYFMDRKQGDTGVKLKEERRGEIE